jgi:hypothetical protein
MAAASPKLDSLKTPLADEPADLRLAAGELASDLLGAEQRAQLDHRCGVELRHARSIAANRLDPREPALCAYVRDRGTS